jgi:hypothetical protein
MCVLLIELAAPPGAVTVLSVLVKPAFGQTSKFGQLMVHLWCVWVKLLASVFLQACQAVAAACLRRAVHFSLDC